MSEQQARLNFCGGGGAVVCAYGWVPEDPFDYGWGYDIGCNRLCCARCGHGVNWKLERGRRLYQCRCDAYSPPRHEYLRIYAGPEHFFTGDWGCAGHPRLELPAVIDGIELPSIGAYEAIVRRTLLNPPFLAPRVAEQTFWVERLYHLMPTEAQRAMVCRAVAALFAGDDAALMNAALLFFGRTAREQGAEQLLEIVERDRPRLKAIEAPALPPRSMYDVIVGELGEWLLYGPRFEGDARGALAARRRALLDGTAAQEHFAHLARKDACWFYDNAAAIVRAQPGALPWVLEELLAIPSTLRIKPLAAMRRISSETSQTMRQWFAARRGRVRKGRPRRLEQH